MREKHKKTHPKNGEKMFTKKLARKMGKYDEKKKLHQKRGKKCWEKKNSPKEGNIEIVTRSHDGCRDLAIEEHPGHEKVVHVGPVKGHENQGAAALLGSLEE